MGDSTSGYVGIFYRKFIFKISHLRPSTPSCMVYREVGKRPLQVTIDKRLMSFCLRLLNKEESSLAHIVYMIAHNLFVRDVYSESIQNPFLTTQSTQIKSVISVPIKYFIHHYPRALFNDIPRVGAHFYNIPGSAVMYIKLSG